MAGVCQQRFCFLDIASPNLGLVHTLHTQRDDGRRACSKAIQHRVDQSIIIDGICHCLADTGIAQQGSRFGAEFGGAGRGHGEVVLIQGLVNSHNQVGVCHGNIVEV